MGVLVYISAGMGVFSIEYLGGTKIESAESGLPAQSLGSTAPKKLNELLTAKHSTVYAHESLKKTVYYKEK